MSRIPRARFSDSSLALLREGYPFISSRTLAQGTDVFETRLLGQRTICMTGARCARLFYNTRFLKRDSAAPMLLQKTLFGSGGVQGLDGPDHRHRKAMFLAICHPQYIARLIETCAEEWQRAGERWQSRDNVVLFDEANEVLARAVCHWSGVPIPEHEVSLRTRQLDLMIESPAAIGPTMVKGILARQAAERWAGRLVRDVRQGKLQANGDEALGMVAWHRDLAGRRLSEHVAAVELLNILRPTVAVARYIVFMAHALHTNPGARERLQSGEWAHEEFIHEVRRFYPFFPFVAARVTHNFAWDGHRFPAGARVILDLYGTNHDPRTWPEPEVFRPERFRDRDIDPFELIPQGGGDVALGHRCAGEHMTVELMKVALRFLLEQHYAVPEQDLEVRLSRMPALPESGFVIQPSPRMAM